MYDLAVAVGVGLVAAGVGWGVGRGVGAAVLTCVGAFHVHSKVHV